MSQFVPELLLIEVDEDLRDRLTHTWNVLFEAFLDDCHDGMRPKTIRYYRCQLPTFFRWIAMEGISPECFREKHLKKYLAHRAQHGGRDGHGVAPKTRANDAEAVRRLMEFAHRANWIEEDPVRNFRTKKVKKTYVFTPEADEVKRLLDAVDETWSIKARPDAMKYRTQEQRTIYARCHKAIIGILAATAMRIDQEVLSLRLDDAKLDDETNLRLIIREGKGGATEEVPITHRCAEMIRAYLRVRPKRSSTDYLFINKYGRKITYDGFNRSFAMYRERAGLPHLKIHGLRHYAANILADTNPRMAQAVLRHKSLKTTEIYLNRSKLVRALYQEADPLGKAEGTARSNYSSNGNGKQKPAGEKPLF